MKITVITGCRGNGSVRILNGGEKMFILFVRIVGGYCCMTGNQWVIASNVK